MGKLCCCGFLSSPPAIVNSNKCQLVSRSSVFIGGDSLPRPIAPLMQWLDRACVWRLVFSFGDSFLSISFVESTGMVDLSDCVGLLHDFSLHRLQFFLGIFLSISFHSFWSHLFLGFLDNLWWSVLCSRSQSTIMLLTLEGQSNQSN